MQIQFLTKSILLVWYNSKTNSGRYLPLLDIFSKFLYSIFYLRSYFQNISTIFELFISIRHFNFFNVELKLFNV